VWLVMVDQNAILAHSVRIPKNELLVSSQISYTGNILEVKMCTASIMTLAAQMCAASNIKGKHSRSSKQPKIWTLENFE
jgi:hypothetical protein